MLKKIKKHFKEEFFRGSFILLVLLNIFNVFNFLFQFGSARLLGPEGYGILGVMLGLVYIFTIPSESIQTILSKYTTKVMKNKGKIKSLFSYFLKKFSFYGFVLFIVFLIISPFLSGFLDVDLAIIILTGISLLCFFILPVGRGILQGQKRFTKLGFTFFAEGIIKFGLAMLLILIGLSVAGAIIAVFAALIFSFLLSVYYIKDILKAKKQKYKVNDLNSYGWPVLISIACLTAFFSLDVILIKRFLPLQEVGYYAAISMIGKLIYFATNPISRALLPLASEKHEKKQSTRELLKKSLIYTFIVAVIITSVCFLIPRFLVYVIYGSDFLAISGLIGFSAIAFSFLSFSQVFVFYYLSKNKKINKVLILSVIIQIIIIYSFHNTLMQYIFAILVSNAILLIMLFVLGVYKSEKPKQV